MYTDTYLHTPTSIYSSTDKLHVPGNNKLQSLGQQQLILPAFAQRRSCPKVK